MLSSFSKMKISTKLPLVMIVLAIMNTGVLFFVSKHFAEEGAVSAAKSKLTAVKAAKKHALLSYLQMIEQDLDAVATNDYTKEAILDFNQAWNEMGGNQMKRLQDLYINNNPHPLGEKNALDFAKDGSSYSSTHAKYHPCLLYTSPSPRDLSTSRMPSSA